MKKLFLIGAGLFAFASADAQAAVKCVNKAGSGGCSSSIQAAVNAAAPGDTVSIAAGVYYENVTVNTQVTILGASKLGTILDPSPSTPDMVSNTGTGITINAAGTSVKNMTIRNGESDGIDVYANNVTILGLRFLGTQSDSIYVGSSYTGTQIIGNEFRAVYEAIYTSSANHNTVIKANRIYDTGDGCIYANGDNVLITSNVMFQCEDDYGIYIGGNTATVTYNTIQGTDSYGIYVSGNASTVAYNRTTLTDSDGIYVSGNAANVHHNTVRTAYSDGIYVSGSGGSSTASFNSVFHADGSGVYVSDTLGATANSNRVTSAYGDGVYAYSGGTGGSATANLNVVTDTTDYGVYAQGYNGATANQNRVTNTYSTGVYTYAYDSNTSLYHNVAASQNVVTSINGYGVESYGLQTTNLRNIIRDVAETGMYTYCYDAMSCASSPVQYNVITNTGEDSYGLYSYTSSAGRNLSYNTVTRAMDYGIYVDGGAHTMVTNRVFDQGGDEYEACYYISSNGNTLTTNQATRCSENGFYVSSDNNTMTGNVVFSSWGNGIELGGGANGNTLTSNRSTANIGAGIAVYGTGNTLNSNITSLNRVGLCNPGTATLSGNTFSDGTTTTCDIDK